MKQNQDLNFKKSLNGNLKATVEIPELRFLFRLAPETHNTGSELFADRKILFIVNQEKITSAFLLDIQHENGGYELFVVERAPDGSLIALEDKLGLIHLILKPNQDQSRYVVSINHPMNQYSLVPSFS